jgi:molybdenum-dependent DNA-binding transcriptional regulator ModE
MNSSIRSVSARSPAAVALGRGGGTVTVRAAASNGEVFINLAGIDLVSIRLVVHCAETGSLSAAARRGNMTLSCASHRLSRLEDFFKVRLFERDYRGLHLTHAGAVFVAYANPVLQAMHGLANQLACLSSGGTSSATGFAGWQEAGAWRP